MIKMEIFGCYQCHHYVPDFNENYKQRGWYCDSWVAPRYNNITDPYNLPGWCQFKGNRRTILLTQVQQ